MKFLFHGSLRLNLERSTSTEPLVTPHSLSRSGVLFLSFRKNSVKFGLKMATANIINRPAMIASRISARDARPVPMAPRAPPRPHLFGQRFKRFGRMLVPMRQVASYSSDSNAPVSEAPQGTRRRYVLPKVFYMMHFENIGTDLVAGLTTAVVALPLALVRSEDLVGAGTFDTSCAPNA